METVTLRIKRTFTDGAFTVEQLCQLTGATPQLIERMVEEEIVHPTDRGTGLLFEKQELGQIERALRLHLDLGVNWSGIAVIEHLIAQVEHLQEELHKRRPPYQEIRETSIDQ